MILLLAFLGCTSPTPAPAGPPVVRSLSHPVGWLVDKLAGDAVDHACVQPADMDARAWQPEPELIASLAKADLVVAQGAGFEAWTATASLRRDHFLDSTAGLELITREAKTHSHGAEGSHSHGAIDPHTWSDPMMMGGQAKAIATRLRPYVDAETLARNLTDLERELAELDTSLRSTLTPLQARPMASNHPAYGYLARRYTLDIREFDLDPTKPITADLTAWQSDDGKTLLWETKPSNAAINSTEGVQHLWVDPLEQPDGGTYDYVRQSKANITRWKTVAP